MFCQADREDVAVELNFIKPGMMLNWAARNKYKLILAILCLYLLLDGILHKGMVRVMLPASYPAHALQQPYKGDKSKLLVGDKQWVQAVNTLDRLNRLPANAAGLECDIYFNSAKNLFEVHHDPGKSTGPDLSTWLQTYQQRKMSASLWLDFKNLDAGNQVMALAELSRLRRVSGLSKKILVESSEATLLTAFSDSGFFTSYYTPLFNPYLAGDAEKKQWADSIAAVLGRCRVDALSGYYFQYPFLQHYFSNYPVLTWAVEDRWSLAAALFRRKLQADSSVFILLYP